MLLQKHNKILNELLLLKSIGYEYHNNNYITSKNYIDLPNDINLLNELIINCNLCSISNTCSNKITYKNKKTDIIILSNINIDKNSKKYNLLLDVLNESLNININDVVLLSILKCNTTYTNLNNFQKELSICKDYTIKQIDLLSPKLIISLGDSYKYLTNNNINNGNIIKYKNIDLFINYDLDYILRNPSINKNFIENFKKIKK